MVDARFRRAILPVILAAAAAGMGAYAGIYVTVHVMGAPWLRDLIRLAAAGGLGTVLYLIVVLLFRRMLPLGRLGRG